MRRWTEGVHCHISFPVRTKTFSEALSSREVNDEVVRGEVGVKLFIKVIRDGCMGDADHFITRDLRFGLAI